MNGLILGGARFGGFILTKQLSEGGDKVCVLNRGNYRESYPDGVEHLKADRNDSKQLEEVLRGRSFDYVIDNNAYNAEQTRRLLGIVGDRCGHYILTSSAAVYMRMSSDVKLKEEDATGIEHKPFSPEVINYAKNKLEAERSLTEFNRTPSTVIRLPNIFGEGDFLGKLLFFNERIKDGKGIVLEEEVREFNVIYAGDIQKIYKSIIGKESCFGKTINIGDPDTINYSSFFDRFYGQSPRVILIPAEKMWDNKYHLPFAFGSEIDMSLSESLLSISYTPVESWRESTLKWETENVREYQKQRYKQMRESELKIFKNQINL